MLDPILICGCPGTGTSLLAKMLRYCGIFLGNDAGPLTDRKFHESECFRDANNQILSRTINFPHAPKGASQFRQHNEQMLAQINEITGLIDVESIMARFWADQDRNQPWGWKDPRNSATAFVWQTFFPRLRVLVLERKWSTKVAEEPAKSLAGRWFRTESENQVRRLYQHPVGIDPSQIVRVDFDRLVTDAQELNSTLHAIGVDHPPIQEFRQFTELVGLE